jgi:predicted MFS family arabinose efflux permease
MTDSSMTAARVSVARVLGIAMLGAFASSVFIRAVDPMIPSIAADLATDPGRVALLATGFALPCALVQPVLGACADLFGKTRLMTLSLAALAATAAASVFATSFSVLLALRILSGLFAGGVIPIALAISGDLVPVNERQVAVGRLLGAITLGNLVGSPAIGAVTDLLGWRGGFAVMALLALAALVAAVIGYRGIVTAPPSSAGLADLPATYREIFRNPQAKICYGSVVVETICLFGLFPFVALLLHQICEERAFVAGLVLSGLGIGGIAYVVLVAKLLERFGEQKLMFSGGLAMGLGVMAVALRLPWQLEFLIFCLLGMGYYLLHGVIQIYATELSATGRTTATALHAMSYSIGQAIGPIVYGAALTSVGLTATVLFTGSMLIVVGAVCAHHLRRTPAASSSARPG